MATFEMTIATNNLFADYQLANMYGFDQAKAILIVSSKIQRCVSICIYVIREFTPFFFLSNTIDLGQ
jgi:hypothetical protein